MEVSRRLRWRRAPRTASAASGSGPARTPLWRALQRCAMSLETLMQLKTRQAQRRDECIAAGVLPDPNRPGLLEGAAKLVGTCMDMCLSLIHI